MKSLLFLISTVFTVSSFAAEKTISCQGTTLLGERVDVSLCASHTESNIYAIVPCEGATEPNVTLFYLNKYSEDGDPSPVMFQVPSSGFVLTIDEDLLSLTTLQNSPGGNFALFYSKKSEFREYNYWDFDIHDSGEADATGLRLKGKFKKFTCSYKL